MKNNIVLLLLIVLATSSCVNNVSTNVSRAEAEARLQALIDEAEYDSYGNSVGAIMTIYSPNNDLKFTGASGFDSKDKTDSLSTDQQFRIASVTKTWVAAAILRLHEMDSLSIDDPISKHISTLHIEMLRDGGYDPDSITLRHCLHHTSGLFDYAMGGSGYTEEAKANPKKEWTRTEQIGFAMRTSKPVGKPGELYRYSDTGYVLLGEILERTTQLNLGAALRKLLKYNQLGINDTYLETVEPTPVGKKDLVHIYFRREEATQWHASVDLWGGGGLVSTTQDLVTFMHALFNHELFDKKETLDLMCSPTSYYASYKRDDDVRYKDYRMGMWKNEIYGETSFQHNGLWGVFLLHIVESNTTISVKYTNGANERLMKKALHLVKNLAKNS